MISTKEIFWALVDVVHEVLPDIFVTADHLQSSEKDYVWIQFKPARRDEGFGITQRMLQTDIQVIFCPDEFTEVYHSALLEIADALDEATCGYIKVLDRYITIYDTSHYIFDDILHYQFVLDFTDYISKDFDVLNKGAKYELMQDLQMKPK